MEFHDFLKEAGLPLDLQWRKYQRRSSRHRVDARLRELGLKDYASYLKRVREEPTEAAGLADRMRVTVTRFYREKERWRQLAETVFPVVLDARRSEKTLRVWSAGCCGGEEPYTMGIIWLEYLQPRYPNHRLRIMATDIDSASLERARRALYRSGSLREVPEDARRRWFHREHGLWRLDNRVRALVQLENRNLITEEPHRDIDVVLCRYLVFTYYRGERRLSAARRLGSAIRPGGALVIGRKEGLGSAERELFEPWPGTEGVFRKVVKIPARDPVPT